MSKFLLTLSLSLALSCHAASAVAQGDSHAGKTKSASCAGCHGEDGNSAMPSFPKLAGQNKVYLVKQLQAFKNGSRIAPMMAPMAMGLDDAAIEDIAAYYASTKIAANPAPVLPAEDDDDDAPAKTEQQLKAELDQLIAKGRDLYRNGNLNSGVSACVACHGPYAEGNKPAGYPALHSQHADYVLKTLSDFKSGSRTKNPDNMMNMIAAKMTAQEIKAVSYYISSMK
jgi:cytochrome c553